MNKLRYSSLLLTTTCITMVPAAEKQPDMVFFEYLAELVEVDGDLVGPIDLQVEENPIPKNKIDHEHKNETSNHEKAKPEATKDTNKAQTNTFIKENKTKENKND